MPLAVVRTIAIVTRDAGRAKARTPAAAAEGGTPGLLLLLNERTLGLLLLTARFRRSM